MKLGLEKMVNNQFTDQIKKGVYWRLQEFTDSIRELLKINYLKGRDLR